MAPPPSAEPLRIVLQFVRTTESGDPYGFEFGPKDYVLPTALGESPSAHFDWNPGTLADLDNLRKPSRDPNLIQRWAERLKTFVWNAGWSQYEPQIRDALNRQQPVEVTIRSSAAELYALPWELLPLRTGQCLGECDTVLIHFAWPQTICQPEQPSPRAEGGRILFAWSAAGGAVPTADHVQALRSAAEIGQTSFQVDRDVLANASLERIAEALAAAAQQGEPISVLHLLCHGGEIGQTFGLCLDGEDEPVTVDASQVRSQLARFASMVRLVVLLACDAGNPGPLGSQLGSVAQALHRCGFQAVIAPRAPLSVSGSVTFAKSFYTKLLGGLQSADSAFLAARKKLLAADSNQSAAARTLDWVNLQFLSASTTGEQTRPIVFRPYRGLLAFQSEHSRFFFGRDAEIAEIEKDLQALSAQGKPRLLFVAGASGTGKSSLVLAGAVPRLLASNPSLVVLRMRPGPSPLRTLDQTLCGISAGQSGLLVIDQFEELFSQTSLQADRTVFVQRLWALAKAPLPGLQILITLRVDYIGRCGELLLDQDGTRLDQVAYDETHRVFVAQLSPKGLTDAIELPARKVGLSLQPGLTERMLAEVGQEPGALPLLQDALDVLWQRRQGSMLTQSAYDELGGVVGALQNRAESLIQKLQAQGDGELTQRLFVNLVAVSEDTALDTRLRVRWADLQIEPDSEYGRRMDRVLGELVAARLVTQDGDAKDVTVEVAHEALIRKWPRLRRWIDEDRAGLLQKRRIATSAKQWEASGEEAALLYRGSQLVIAEEWRKTWNARMSGLEQKFIQAALAQRDLEAQKQSEQAQREKESAAQILALLLDSYVEKGHRLLGDGLPEEALLWLHRAYLQGLRSDALLFLLRRAMQPIDQRKDVFDPDRIALPVFAATSFGGQLLVAIYHSGDVDIIDRESGQTLSTCALGRRAVFDPSGKRILFYGERDSVLVDASSGAVLLRFPIALVRASFSPDGSAVLAVTMQHSFVVMSPESGTCSKEIPSDPRIGQIWNVSPDGKRLLCQTEDLTWQIVTVDGLEVISRFPAPPGSVAELGSLDAQGQRALIAFVPSNRVGHLQVSVYDVAQSKLLCSVSEVVWMHSDSALLSSDGTQLVLATNRSSATLFDAGTGRVLSNMQVQKSDLTAMSFSSDGSEIILQVHVGTIFIYTTKGSALIEQRPAPARGYDWETGQPEEHSPTGRYELRIQERCELSVEDWARESYVTTLHGHQGPVTFFKWSRDLRWLATASEDQTVRIWNAKTFFLHRVLSSHHGAVIHVAFSSDSQRIVSCGADGEIRMFDVDTGFLLAVYSVAPLAVSAAYFEQEDRYVIAVCSDGQDRMFDAQPEARSPEVLATLIERRCLLRFDPPNGRTIVENWWKR